MSKDSSQKSKKLIVIRHAHRDVMDPLDDNGLSAKGRGQAQAIFEYFKTQYASLSPRLISSPKLRCQETIEPLGDFYKREIEISQLLDEGSQIQFGNVSTRINEFIRLWKNEFEDFVVICSHGDWIPDFLHIAAGEMISLKKAGLVEIVKSDAQLKIEKIIQSWK